MFITPENSPYLNRVVHDAVKDHRTLEQFVRAIADAEGYYLIAYDPELVVSSSHYLDDVVITTRKEGHLLHRKISKELLW
jgi:hypothetical protein